MNKQKMAEVLNLIESSNKIVISRHKRPDGDAIGSSSGLKEILKLSYPQKQVFLINEDGSDIFDFLDKADEIKDEDFYKDALVITTDTANTDRLSNKFALKAPKVLKIDHHVEVENFGDVSWVESSCSSCSEMIATLQMEFSDRLKLNKAAALCLYTGIITDNGDFKYLGTDGDTFRTAAHLVDTGIDLQSLQEKISLEDPVVFKFQGYVLRKMRTTENGVVYVYISQKIQQKLGLNREQASASVNFIGSIRNTHIWLAFIENKDHSIRVRVRSRNIDMIPLSSRFGGGGHKNACGANCNSKKEMKDFIQEADKLCRF